MSQGHKVDGGHRGQGRAEGRCLSGTEFPFVKMESSGDGQWKQLHNMNELSAPELCTYKWLRRETLCCAFCTAVLERSTLEELLGHVGPGLGQGDQGSGYGRT